jgi:hypothetical protein
MEFHCTDVVQMSQQSKETTTEFVVPHLDFIIVAAGNYEGFVEVKVDSADWTIVFLEAIDDGANSIIPPDVVVDDDEEWEQRERERVWGGVSVKRSNKIE